MNNKHACYCCHPEVQCCKYFETKEECKHEFEINSEPGKWCINCGWVPLDWCKIFKCDCNCHLRWEEV